MADERLANFRSASMLATKVRQALAAPLSDFFQAIPKRIFKAYAGLVTIDNDRALDDCGFHGGCLTRYKPHRQYEKV